MSKQGKYTSILAYQQKKAVKTGVRIRYLFVQEIPRQTMKTLFVTKTDDHQTDYTYSVDRRDEDCYPYQSTRLLIVSVDYY